MMLNRIIQVAIAGTVMATVAGAQSPIERVTGSTGAPASIRVFRDGDAAIAVQRLPQSAASFATDFVTGRVGALIGNGDTTRLHFIDNGANDPSPERLVFSSSNPARLHILESGRPTRTATEVPLRAEEVTFVNGDVTLAGLLVLPAGKGPHPAVVFFAGSGPSSRGSFPSWGALLATHGIASLSFDKRGTGASNGGPWQFVTLEQHTSDGRAAVSLLRRRPEIQGAKIGLLGTSAGAWIAALIAADDPEIAYVVASSGGGVSVNVQEVHRRTRLVSDSGYSPATVDTARGIVERYFRFLASGGADSSGLSELWRTHASARWFKHLLVPATDPTVGEWPPFRRAFGRDLALLDSLPRVHARMRQPILSIVSDSDPNMPAKAIVSAFETELPNGRSGQLSAVILKGADHGMRLPRQPDDIPRWHPDYWPTMITFIRSHSRR